MNRKRGRTHDSISQAIEKTMDLPLSYNRVRQVVYTEPLPERACPPSVPQHTIASPMGVLLCALLVAGVVAASGAWWTRESGSVAPSVDSSLRNDATGAVDSATESRLESDNSTDTSPRPSDDMTTIILSVRGTTYRCTGYPLSDGLIHEQLPIENAMRDEFPVTFAVKNLDPAQYVAICIDDTYYLCKTDDAPMPKGVETA